MTPAPNIDGLIERLRNLARAYPVDIFGDVTDDERKGYGALVQKAAAGMGRHFAPTFTEAADALAALRAELERERMRLAACGVVAMANTSESAANAREMHPDYRSDSCDEVAKAVDREMALRAERDAALAREKGLREAAENLVRQKGRHNTEIAYHRLVAALAAKEPKHG